MTKRIRTFALSDIGLVRSNNEDEFLIQRHRGMTVLAVADGMGGAAGGEVASHIAVETIRELVRGTKRNPPVPDMVFECIQSAHGRIRRRGKTDFGQINMGTTLKFIVIRKIKNQNDSFEIFLGHVGDSRFYLMEKEKLRQISRDHSMKQYMMDMGLLKNQDEMVARYKNIIYRSLGGASEVEIDPVKRLVVGAGAVVLLCTDGLTNYVSDKEITEIIRKGGGLKRIGHELVNKAMKRGGGDNITLILGVCGRRKKNGAIGRHIASAMARRFGLRPRNH